MWKCPKCGIDFKNINQSHFCGEVPKSIDDYIAAQSEAVKPTLNNLRDILRGTLFNAQECISWRMPTYRGDQNIIHFAAHKKHIGLYPGEKAIVYFADRLSEYKSSKGAVQFPYDKPLPLELIAEIAKWCNENDH